MVGGYYLDGLEGVLCGLVVVRVIDWLMKVVAVRRQAHNRGIRIRYRGCTQELGVLWHFSIRALISNAMVVPVNWVCCAMLVNQPNGICKWVCTMLQHNVSPITLYT